MFDGLDNESNLNRTIRVGLKRIDDAVEGVIDKHSVYAPASHLSYAQANKIMNMSLSKVIEEMAIAAPKIWPTDRCGFNDNSDQISEESIGYIAGL